MDPYSAVEEAKLQSHRRELINRHLGVVLVFVCRGTSDGMGSLMLWTHSNKAGEEQ